MASGAARRIASARSRVRRIVGVPASVSGIVASLLFIVAGAGAAGRPAWAAPDIGTEAQRAAGKTLYEHNCAQCHGDKGDGEGYATPHLRPKPRNFTTGKFKVRTTPNGALPTHDDLKAIIRRGMPYTSMPPWPSLSDEQLSNLAYYITTFSEEFAKPDNDTKPIPLPSAPRPTKESIAKGKTLYEANGCIKCHGNLGRGDGPSAPTLVDDWGGRIKAADLTQTWTFRGGPTREDIFRTMSTGLNGTPMPSFLEALKEEDRWAITDYIDSLSGGPNAGYANLLMAKHVDDPIDLTKGAAGFEGAKVARFPIVGQIMEPGRSFHPPVVSIQVQAVYDSENIAFLVRWNDMSAETTGTNGPALPVPIEEEEQPDGAPGANAAAAPAGEGGGVWGDEEAAPASVGTPAAPATDDIWGESEGTAAAAPKSEFSDAVALQFPSQLPTGPRKPYFIFGDLQNSVDLWFYDLAKPEPLQFTGRGSADLAANDTGDLSGTTKFEEGQWSVIFKRPLRATSGVPFEQGHFVPIAFSVWDGHTRERGNKRGLTVWYHTYMEPEAVPSPAGPMVKTAIFVLLAEVIVIALVRWQQGRAGAAARRSGFGHEATQT